MNEHFPDQLLDHRAQEHDPLKSDDGASGAATPAEKRQRRPAPWALWLMLAFTLCLRLGALWHAYGKAPNHILSEDSGLYTRTAHTMLLAGRFAQSTEPTAPPEVMRTPGYPAFIAALWAVFGERPVLVIVAQILLSVGTLALAYGIARRLWGARVALAATALLTLDPLTFYYSQLLLTETLYTFLMAATGYAGVRAIMNGRQERRWTFLMGLLLGAATLTRPIGYYLVFPIFIGLAVVKRREGRPWSGVALLLLLMMAPWLALVGGWKLRNLRLTGRAELSYVKDYDILWYQAAAVIGIKEGLSTDAVREKLEKQMPDMTGWRTGDRYAYYQKEGLAIIRRHPTIFIKTQLVGVTRMMLGPSGRRIRDYMDAKIPGAGPISDLRQLPPREYLRRWLGQYPGWLLLFLFECAFMALLYAGTLIGVGRTILRDRGRWPVQAFLLGVILYFMMISVGVDADARFRTPIMPYLTFFAGLGLAMVAGWTLSRKSKRESL